MKKLGTTSMILDGVKPGYKDELPASPVEQLVSCPFCEGQGGVFGTYRAKVTFNMGWNGEREDSQHAIDAFPKTAICSDCGKRVRLSIIMGN